MRIKDDSYWAEWSKAVDTYKSSGASQDQAESAADIGVNTEKV